MNNETNCANETSEGTVSTGNWVNFEENGAERKKLDGELRDYELNRQKSLKKKRRWIENNPQHRYVRVN